MTRPTIYARRTPDGIAVIDTAVCVLHLDDSRGTEDTGVAELEDCTGNEALECVTCGAR